MHTLIYRSTEMYEQQVPLVIVVLGPPGAGKGTQSSMLADLLRLPHISIGSLLRSYARDESEVAVALTRTMALGNLVPDTLVLDVLAARMSEPDCARGLILDGFPRTLKQAERLERGPLRSQFCANDRTENLLAIHLRVQNSTIVERLSGRRICSRCSASYHVDRQPPRVNGECDLDGSALTVREDDRRTTVRKRLRLYEEQTVPILSHYAEQRNLLEVDGEQHRENIVEEIMRAIQSMHCIAIGGQKTPTGRNLIQEN